MNVTEKDVPADSVDDHSISHVSPPQPSPPTPPSLPPPSHDQHIDKHGNVITHEYKTVTRADSGSNKRRILYRWLGTVALCAMIVGILKGYESQGIVPGDQNVFQALSQGVAIFLGFNITSALKELASLLESKLIYPGDWEIWRRDSDPQKRDRMHVRMLQKSEADDSILWDNRERFSIGSFQNLIYLVTRANGNRKTRLVMFLWLLVAGLGPSVIVALIGLNYNYESTNELGTTPHRTVNMTTFDGFRPLDEDVFDKHVVAAGLDFNGAAGEGDLSLNAKFAIAHTYGEMSMVLPTHDELSHDYDPSEVFVEQLPGQKPEWVYFFREATPDSHGEKVVLQHRTRRSVTVTPKCEYAQIISGQFSDSADNNESVIIKWADGVEETINDVWLEVSTSHPNSTTWTYIHTDGTADCGPRCANIFAVYTHERETDTDNRPGHFFDCNVTISEMHNRDQENQLHDIPNDVAQLLAGSIALSSDGGNFEDPKNQYSTVTYHSGIAWGNLTSDVLHTENLLGRFAAGAIAMMDKFNDKKLGAGESPWVGTKLVVKWKWIAVNIGVIIVVQGLCALLALWYNSRHEARAARPADDGAAAEKGEMPGEGSAHGSTSNENTKMMQDHVAEQVR